MRFRKLSDRAERRSRDEDERILFRAMRDGIPCTDVFPKASTGPADVPPRFFPESNPKGDA